MTLADSLAPQPLAIPENPIVRLCDGTVGEQTWASSTEAHIVHGDRALGRGPWVMYRSQLSPASPAEKADYLEGVLARLRAEWAPAEVISRAEQRAIAARQAVRS